VTAGGGAWTGGVEGGVTDTEIGAGAAGSALTPTLATGVETLADTSGGDTAGDDGSVETDGGVTCAETSTPPTEPPTDTPEEPTPTVTPAPVEPSRPPIGSVACAAVASVPNVPSTAPKVHNTRARIRTIEICPFSERTKLARYAPAASALRRPK
jgi:hypothetical protein